MTVFLHYQSYVPLYFKNFCKTAVSTPLFIMNIARTVVSVVSKSKQTQMNTEPSTRNPATGLVSFTDSAESINQIFSLRDIAKEHKVGDQECEMLMLDG